MELKILSPVLLTGENSEREKGEYYLKEEFLKETVKEVLLYFALKESGEIFDQFYKKLLKLFEDRREGGVSLASLWLEKKVLCGGEPEIAHGKVVNYNEEKNVLKLLKFSNFKLEGKTERVRVKQAGKPKRYIGIRLAATEGSFKGDFEIAGLEKYENFPEKPFPFEAIRDGKIGEVLNLFFRKLLEMDKEFYADFGYSGAVKFLEELEAEGQLLRLNFKKGLSPFGVELFCYELLETAKGRKELHHLSEILSYLRSKGLGGEIISQIRLLVSGKPVGWVSVG